MALTVTIFTLDQDAQDVVAGVLSLVGNKIVIQPSDRKNERLLRSIAAETIYTPDPIDPLREPEAFLQKLHMAYRSPYLRASHAEPTKEVR